MDKTNLGLVDYCKKQLGLPYWWGGTGQIATKTLYEQLKRQYPNQYLWTDFKNQFGQRVHDCVGLIKGYMLLNDEGKRDFDTPTFQKYDKDVSGMMKQCTALGPVCNIPEVPGLLVFMKGHVGVYIGNGKVIEAKGHAYGVVETELKKRPWEMFGRLGWLEYIEEEEEMLDGKIVTMITGLCNKYGTDNIEKAISRLTETFIDDGEPSGWAASEVEEAKKLGLTDGSRPEMYATRQEVSMMVLRGYKMAKNGEKTACENDL